MSESPETLRRWRLMMGDCGNAPEIRLSAEDIAMDNALTALYRPDAGSKGGLGPSCPNVNRWLGDIRNYFPSDAVQVMQKDALNRLHLDRMLMEPELMQMMVPDVHLIATILSLKNVIPAKTKETARMVVKKVVDELQKKLSQPMISAVKGSLSKAARTSRPRFNEIDWHKTITKNLHTWQKERRIIIPERLVGFGRKRTALRDIVLCVDQSGSMASSVVYAGIFGAVLASLSAVKTSMVLFDTEICDLSEQISDPVDLLFGAQLGGGTDINMALGYCQQIIREPSKTIMVLITDLYEGGDTESMLRRAAQLTASGVQVICLLALSDDGRPCFDKENAEKFGAMGIPTFSCTPNLFPDLMAQAIQKRDISSWASRNSVVVQ